VNLILPQLCLPTLIVSHFVLTCFKSSYDLMQTCDNIGKGKLHVPELLGDVRIKPISPDGAYDVKLDSKRVQNDQILQLLRRYTGRKSFSGK
jgi:glutamate--cysteine ligase catalytic subunit